MKRVRKTNNNTQISLLYQAKRWNLMRETCSRCASIIPSTWARHLVMMRMKALALRTFSRRRRCFLTCIEHGVDWTSIFINNAQWMVNVSTFLSWADFSTEMTRLHSYHIWISFHLEGLVFHRMSIISHLYQSRSPRVYQQLKFHWAPSVKVASTIETSSHQFWKMWWSNL